MTDDPSRTPDQLRADITALREQLRREQERVSLLTRQTANLEEALKRSYRAAVVIRRPERHEDGR
jgi:hypothetical protein